VAVGAAQGGYEGGGNRIKPKTWVRVPVGRHPRLEHPKWASQAIREIAASGWLGVANVALAVVVGRKVIPEVQFVYLRWE
jgi:hypothetical protein